MRSRDRTTFVAGLATLAVGVLVIGGATRWVVLTVAGLAAITATTQLRSHRRLDKGSPLLLLIAVPIILTAIQLIPLPNALRTVLSPTSQELILDSEALLDPSEVPIIVREPDGSEVIQRVSANDQWHPLSEDPATTRSELAKLCAYWLFAWMALRAAANERGRQYLLAGVAGIAGLVAVIGLVHELLDADSLYGLYEPANAHPIVMAPLLNANHLACLMVLGAILAGGLALNERRAPPIRAMWIVVTVLCVFVALATRSRGGVVGLAAGVTVSALIVVLQRLRSRRRTHRRDVLRIIIPGAVVLMCSLVLAVSLGGGVRHDLEATRLAEFTDPNSKFGAWRSAIKLIAEAPLFGNGRGAFESAFTRVHDVSGQVTFSHVENEYLQVLLDWGVIGGILLAVALGACVLVVLRRRWRAGMLTAVAIGGLAGVAVHSLVDFGMELPGVALPVILVAATLLYVPLVNESRTAKRTILRSLPIVATLGVAVFAALPGGKTLSEDHIDFADERPTLDEARESLARHPLDYLSAAFISRSAETSRERVAFLNHALRLHPTHPGLHRAAAIWLAESGHTAQAAFEFRSALINSGDPEALVGETLKYFPKAEVAATALPADYALWYRVVNALQDSKRDDVALLYMLEVVVLDPHPNRELWRRISALAEKIGAFTAAERADRMLVGIDRTVASKNELARILMLAKKFEEARSVLKPIVVGEPSNTEQIDSRMMLCDLDVETKEWHAGKDCFTTLLKAPISSMATRKRIHGQLSKIWAGLGDTERSELERRLSEGELTHDTQLQGGPKVEPPLK